MSGYDDLELELRKLPGVRSAGFTQRDDMLFVQLHTMGATGAGGSGLALQATRLASRHSERPVAVELVRWRMPVGAPEPSPTSNGEDQPEVSGAVDLAEDTRQEREPRVKLLAVLSFPDTDEIEVHLTLGGQRTIGRAMGSRGLISAVEATIDALRAFLPALVFSPSWAREVDAAEEVGRVVSVGLTDGRAPRHGIAAGDTDMEAAARATLDALNRTLAPELSTTA